MEGCSQTYELPDVRDDLVLLDVFVDLGKLPRPYLRHYVGAVLVGLRRFLTRRVFVSLDEGFPGVRHAWTQVCRARESEGREAGAEKRREESSGGVRGVNVGSETGEADVARRTSGACADEVQSSCIISTLRRSPCAPLPRRGHRRWHGGQASRRDHFTNTICRFRAMRRGRQRFGAPRPPVPPGGARGCASCARLRENRCMRAVSGRGLGFPGLLIQLTYNHVIHITTDDRTIPCLPGCALRGFVLVEVVAGGFLGGPGYSSRVRAVSVSGVGGIWGGGGASV
jgi:hypothetical protein